MHLDERRVYCVTRQINFAITQRDETTNDWNRTKYHCCRRSRVLCCNVHGCNNKVAINMATKNTRYFYFVANWTFCDFQPVGAFIPCPVTWWPLPVIWMGRGVCFGEQGCMASKRLWLLGSWGRPDRFCVDCRRNDLAQLFISCIWVFLCLLPSQRSPTSLGSGAWVVVCVRKGNCPIITCYEV